MILNQWYAVCNAKKIKKNRIYALKRLGLDLALFRTQNGRLGCVSDQCTHRGAGAKPWKTEWRVYPMSIPRAYVQYRWKMHIYTRERKGIHRGFKPLQC